MLDSLTPLAVIPRLPIGEWIDSGFDWFKETFETFFDAVGDAVEAGVEGVAGVLNGPEPLVTAIIFALLAWLIRDWKLGIGTLIGMVFIISADMWEPAMDTLALVLLATVVAVVIGVPLGILGARSTVASRILKPIMDLMQTMPSLVWLIPVVSLFSIGVAGALVSTVIFALPPAVRLTELGIRQVDHEVVEAGHAFGANGRQILKDIQFPLAMPTVMAGINQVIMLALSMAVIAGFVGGGGLGNEVVKSISRVDIGLGFEAGLAVVVLAIFLDRLTGSIGSRRPGHGRMRELRNRISSKDVEGEKAPSRRGAGVGA